MSDHNHEDFLYSAGFFEFAMLVIGLFLGWVFSVEVADQIHWNWTALMWGSLAGIVLFLLVMGLEHLPFDPLRSIQDRIIATIGKELAKCTLLELALISLLAGLGEEVLFRGFLMTWLESMGGYSVGLGVSSIVFGLVHSITWLYMIFTALSGLFLGWLFDATGERNLLVPIVCHALYDFLAFIVIAREARKTFGDALYEEEAETENEFEW